MNDVVSIGRFSRMSGLTIDADVVLALPELADRVALAREALVSSRTRPEYEQFDRARDRATRQQALETAADQPQVSAWCIQKP